MKINLKTVPKAPTIIEGFPGFGLVGTIVTDYLIRHLNAKQIGEFEYSDLPAVIAIHETRMERPMAIFYAKKNNLMILHTKLITKGKEWKIAEAIIEMAKKTKAKEVISIEGVGSSSGEEDTKLYSWNNKALEKLGTKPVQESIIMGVTAAMMLRYNKMCCLLAGTQSQGPDSKAAAKVIEMLDKYLKLKVDYEPLIKQAKEVEEKTKNIIQQSSQMSEAIDKKNMSYLG